MTVFLAKQCKIYKKWNQKWMHYGKESEFVISTENEIHETLK